MIAFDLRCANDHVFEGWFEDSEAYGQQKKKGLIACPICNDTRVQQVPSTFAIRSAAGAAPSAPAGGVSEQLQLAQVGRKIAEFIETHFDDVGADFSSEALKMHYGVAEPRSIRGTSTEHEEKTLKAEGVQFFKFPLMVPRDSDA